MPGLVVAGLGHAYGRHRVVQGINLAVRPGELVCLLGPSGCGKSTVLRVIAGLEEIQEGRITINGRLVAGDGVCLPPEARRVGLMFQDFALFPHLNVLDNVAFGLAGMPATRRRERARALLAWIGMADHANSYPHMLSGGQQQRVALARALAPGPEVMLLDEPFSGLDARLRNQVRDETLRALKEMGTPTLLVTHDPDEALRMADRIAVMSEGGILQEGCPADLYRNPADALVAGFFGEANHLRGEVSRGAVATPFGPVRAPDLPERTPVDVLIRPEALRILLPGQSMGTPATVTMTRALGHDCLVHLRPENGGGAYVARTAALSAPHEGSRVGVVLDLDQVFVFPSLNA
jgi:iron(III) transport system ATP-binding protein